MKEIDKVKHWCREVYGGREAEIDEIDKKRKDTRQFGRSSMTDEETKFLR